MDYFRLLFSFEGRINRAKYWYVSLAGLCSYLVFCVLMAELALALGGNFGVTSVNVHVFPAFTFHASFRDVSPASSAALIYPLFYAVETPFLLIGMWFVAATTIKRLHDRNKSGWWLVPFFIAPSLLNKPADWLENPVLALLVGALGLGLGVWCFVELFCLRGAKAPNRFGPDPLAPRDTRPRWEQQSELEFVPHSAGPSPAPHVKRGA
jgi:uncharacterized membrane protein YhaH (DUF805 family)